MEIRLNIVTTPTADTQGTTLILHTANRSYVFGNESEGTQRALTAMGHRVTKVQDFFITGKTEWSNMGGLIGMSLTLADATTTAYETTLQVYRAGNRKNVGEPQRPKLSLYGPPNLKHMLATCRRFIFRKGLPLIATEYKSESPTKTLEGVILPTWQDENIKVWAVSVAPAHTPRDPQADAVFTESCKRFDETLNTFDDFQAVEGESTQERELRYDQIRTSVLNHMFDSTWSFDTLVERHISEIEMPTAMYVRDPTTQRLEPYRGPLPGGKEPLPDITVLTRTPWPGAMVLDLPPTTPAPESVSYIVRPHAVRGKFDARRAKELGLKPGPQYKTLTDGLPVTNSQGETITSDMVMGPDRPGQGFAILDVPSVGHLESLVRREEFTSGSVMDNVQVCVWILGPGLSRNPILKQFMEQLGQVKHFISTTDESPNRLAFDRAATQTIHLGEIDAERYHVPVHDNTTIPQNRIYGKRSHEGELAPGALIAERGLRFRLMPTFAVEKTEIPPLLDVSAVQKDLSPDISELAKSAHDEIRQNNEALDAWQKLLARPDTEIITLGTGSALPSLHRNVSATLVRVPGVGNYLFDCGEGTLGQLQRVFNPEQLIGVLKDLRMIWISHLHADHHLGTTSVIRAWYAIKHNGIPAAVPANDVSITQQYLSCGLSVVSHSAMLKWLNEYSSIEDFGLSRILPLEITPTSPGTDNGTILTSYLALSPSEYTNGRILDKSLYQTVLGLSDIQACKVAHCHGAMAVSLTFPDASEDVQSQPPKHPLKVSYSGDCRPSNNFALIGRNTTVLIHEATFDDEMAADARAKKHSTTSEALSIGVKMDAKGVILTHFSQRYGKIPVLQTLEDGDGKSNTLDPDAIATEDPADEEDVDTNTGNMDMTKANAGSPSSAGTAFPSHQPPALQKTHEKVIRVKAKEMKVAVAFDYMRIRIGDIAKQEKFNKALNLLLVEETEVPEVSEVLEEKNNNGKRPSPNTVSSKRKTQKTFSFGPKKGN